MFRNRRWDRQIRDLEDEIGFCLLERTAKSVRLTDAGRVFLSDADEEDIFKYFHFYYRVRDV